MKSLRYNLCLTAYRPPSRKGCFLTPEHKHKIGIGQRGRVTSRLTRLRLSKSLKGMPKSKEWREHLAAAHRGKKISDATRKKMAIAHRGLKHTRAAKDKIGAANRGRKHSPEAIAKMATVRRLYYAQRQQTENDLATVQP